LLLAVAVEAVLVQEVVMEVDSQEVQEFTLVRTVIMQFQLLLKEEKLHLLTAGEQLAYLMAVQEKIIHQAAMVVLAVMVLEVVTVVLAAAAAAAVMLVAAAVVETLMDKIVEAERVALVI
jgi:hypothetical protein